MVINFNLNVSRAFENSLLALIQGAVITEEQQHQEILSKLDEVLAEIQAQKADQSKIDEIGRRLAENESKLSDVLPPNN